MALFDVLAGMVLMWVFYRYKTRPLKTLIAALVGMAVFAFGASFLLFKVFAYWANFGPVLVGYQPAPVL